MTLTSKCILCGKHFEVAQNVVQLVNTTVVSHPFMNGIALAPIDGEPPRYAHTVCANMALEIPNPTTHIAMAQAATKGQE